LNTTNLNNRKTFRTSDLDKRFVLKIRRVFVIRLVLEVSPLTLINSNYNCEFNFSTVYGK